MLEAATLLLFPALMAFAAISDLLTMTISNRISLALAVLFVGMAIACGLTAAEIAWHLACGALMLVLRSSCSPAAGSAAAMRNLRRRRRSRLCFEHIGDYAFSASILGALLALILLGLRKWSRPDALPQPQWIARLLDPSTGTPYGVALACTGLLLYPRTAIWLGAANTLG